MTKVGAVSCHGSYGRHETRRDPFDSRTTAADLGSAKDTVLCHGCTHVRHTHTYNTVKQ